MRETARKAHGEPLAAAECLPGLGEKLLSWFEQNKRVLPVRTDPTPYHVWVSEIMLQQTRVSAALPYYERFIRTLPDVPALAACPPEQLNKLWEGLGYYSRVRNMQKAAQIVCDEYGGALPADYEALLALPGIGEYTAGAIGSISFGLRVPAVDGNVLRVFARLYDDEGYITDPKVKQEFTRRVMAHQPPALRGTTTRPSWSWGRWSACPAASRCAGSARWPPFAVGGPPAEPGNCPARLPPRPGGSSR